MQHSASTLEPIVVIAIEPKSKADQEKLGLALAKRANADPALHVSIDPESGQTILGGQSESHLGDVIDALGDDFGPFFNIGAPQVAYRETLTKRVEIDYVHKKQTGGTGQFARVKLVVEPNEAGKGFAFESKIIGGAVPKEYIPGVEKGLNSVISSGVLAGFPVVDVKVSLVDGAFHEVDSSALAFEIASRAALREGLQKGGSVLLEPIMKVEVVTPEDYTGSVIGDLNSRRARFDARHSRGTDVAIVATVPLSCLFGYANQLRALTEGHATFTMRFFRYDIVPSMPDGGEPPPAVAASLRA
jgi:elongation factor G